MTLRNGSLRSAGYGQRAMATARTPKTGQRSSLIGMDYLGERGRGGCACPDPVGSRGRNKTGEIKQLRIPVLAVSFWV